MYKHILRVPVHFVQKPRYFKHQQLVRLIQTTSNHYKEQEQNRFIEPEKRSGFGRKFFYTLGAVVIGTGSVIAYAKFDDDFRKWLRENIPGSDEFISFVTTEETTHIDYLTRALENIKDGVMESANSLLGLTTEEKKDDSKKHLPPCDEQGKPYSPEKVIQEKVIQEKAKSKADTKSREETLKNKGDPEVKNVISDSEAKAKTKSDPKKDPKENKADSKKDIKQLSSQEKAKGSDKKKRGPNEVEKEFSDNVATAIDAYKNAICFLQEYTDSVNAIVDNSIEKQDPKIWPELLKKTNDKDARLKNATEAAALAEAKVHHLQREIDDVNLPGTTEEKNKIREKASALAVDMANAKDEFIRERRMANVTSNYWEMVEQARTHFQNDLGTLFPNFSVSDKEMKLAVTEMDLFILYAFQTILFYQKELARLDTQGQAKLAAALDKLPNVDVDAVKCLVEQEVEKEKRKVCSDYQKKLLELKSECEQKAKESIKNHNLAHAEILQDALSQKEIEVSKKMKRQLDEQLLEEKERYREEMASLLGRLKGMDELMKKRAGQEKKAVQAQLLWSTCEALVSAITCERDCSAVSMKSLKAQIHAIELAASKDDELVQAVLASIPKVAVERGIFAEPALKERFNNTARVARRVALLPEGGASLPIMFLSYLQSLLVISPTIPIPSQELNNEPVNPASFNTFEILQRSKYWMDRGDWYQVLRYMNLLKGASRAVAQDFMEEVKVFLETKQAAEVLISHASATALVV